MSILQIKPIEASAKLADGDTVYLDVRTVPEFVAGHAPGAINIPVAEMNPMLGRLEANPRFLDVVKSTVPLNACVIVGCKSGGRSQMAAEMMTQAGYRNVSNLCGGFLGVMAPSGEPLEDGWCGCGLPVERGDGGEKGYAAIYASSRAS